LRPKASGYLNRWIFFGDFQQQRCHLPQDDVADEQVAHHLVHQAQVCEFAQQQADAGRRFRRAFSQHKGDGFTQPDGCARAADSVAGLKCSLRQLE
jgi:hypothetical protein